LLLCGAVGLADLVLPGGRQADWPAWIQPAAAAILLAIGGGLFFVGRRWN
jgi:hypothetical protein